MRVLRIKEEGLTLVESESSPGVFYEVSIVVDQERCACPQFTKRGIRCKHIEAANAAE